MRLGAIALQSPHQYIYIYILYPIRFRFLPRLHVARWDKLKKVKSSIGLAAIFELQFLLSILFTEWTLQLSCFPVRSIKEKRFYKICPSTVKFWVIDTWPLFSFPKVSFTEISIFKYFPMNLFTISWRISRSWQEMDNCALFLTIGCQ